jgi:hypothetical protein
MIAVNHILRSDTLFAGTNGNGHTMLITSADEQYLALLQSEITHIDISRYIYTSQVSDMYAAISVG